LIGAVVAEFVAGTGGRNTGLAHEILQSGYQLDIPRMFAALFLITLAGIAMFLVVVSLTRLALGSWHDSAVAREA
jgi:NitT/TauT family transport system permease protein